MNTRLSQLDNPTQYLTLVKKYDQHELSLLMLAAFFGYDDIVRVLLSHDNTPDHVELKGKVVISDELMNGATALYCACYRGHFTVATILIELGHANVNQVADDRRSRPLLHHATVMNRRDVIEFLLENKYVDVNETKTFDKRQDTALIEAAWQGYTSLAEYLIAKGADVNYSCRKDEDVLSWSPICYAMLNGHIDVVQLLYRAGADPHFKNNDDKTFIIDNVVEEKYPMIIGFLLDESVNSIEDLELAACSLVSPDSTMEQLSYILSILKMAIERRVRFNLPKVPLERISVYDNHQECCTVDELDSIKEDQHRMYIETLLIRERIALSRPVRCVVEPLQRHGISLVEREQYEKAYNWWIHTFHLRQRLNIETRMGEFVWLFCRMMRVHGTIPVEWFLKVARLVLEPSHLKANHNSLNPMYLIVIATKILEQEELSQSDRTSIYSWVKDVCQLRLSCIYGRTLLHLCVDAKTNKIVNFRPNDVRRSIRYVCNRFMLKKEFIDGFL